MEPSIYAHEKENGGEATSNKTKDAMSKVIEV